ncbi:TetR/AcrR family transcriptional regulator [Thermasporomyces composti]|jgi:AcrR family transcriptional regulator|uniref:TetR family transcriptional regulator n=1 Tax=Thermasporomyces composti TaxID=696763 RepID=A0A3D9V968_THECX|nr:TetR family transcriptional regulator [Thermasporomyces composti]REF38328.1 TetR family transcriptional regulator [Thermasporomyces composti]
MSRRRAPRQAEAERNDRALLRAAREVLAADGAHASVAAIAARAGVGIGTLYRRYRTKEELFQRLAELALDSWNEAAEKGLAEDDPWEGLTSFVIACVESGQGSLAPLAGTIDITEEMRAKNERSDELLAALVERAHAAGVLRPDVTPVDIALLIEQLGRFPVLDQLRAQGRDDLVDLAVAARRRVIAVVLDGLRPCHTQPLPGDPPSDQLFTERWARHSAR